MKIKIDFFREEFIEAIGAGIYKVSIKYADKEELLYIGESVFILVRCATHLFKLKSNPNYFGFTDESIQDENITLKMELIETCDDKKKRKQLEKQLITINKPIMQSGISDRMKDIDEKIDALTEFLNS